MARVDVPIVKASFNAATTVSAVTADATDNMQIDVSEDMKSVLVRLIGDSTNEITYDFKAGAGSMASQGDLTVAVAAGANAMVNLESARFKDADGLILIDVTGTVVTAALEALATPV